MPNGLVLCALHHKIFDLGAFTVLTRNHQIVFNRHLMGRDDAKAKLLADFQRDISRWNHENRNP